MRNGVKVADIYRINIMVLNFSVRFVDAWGRCKWSPNIGEPVLFIKYEMIQLNLLDCEKKSFILKEPVQLDDKRKHFNKSDILLSSLNLEYIEKKIMGY